MGANKVYRGKRTGQRGPTTSGAEVEVQEPNGSYPLPQVSARGSRSEHFDWGIMNADSENLSISLLSNALGLGTDPESVRSGDSPVSEFYQRFDHEFLLELLYDQPWRLTQIKILDWVRQNMDTFPSIRGVPASEVLTPILERILGTRSTH